MSATLAGRRARDRRARAVVAALVLLPGATGCYANVPVWNGTPSPNSAVTLGISDRGRAVLAAQLGPGVRRISGHLERTTDSAFVVSVTAVDYVSSSSAGSWSGEEVTVPRDFISGVSERRFSRGRTWVATGIAVVAVALATTIAIKGFGNDPPGSKPTDGGGQQQ